MYLSERNRAQVRKYIKKCQSGSKPKHPGNLKNYNDTLATRKVSQILFDARDGKEVFTPF